VYSKFRVQLATLAMMLTPLQLPSVHHIPSCDGVRACARDAEEWKDNAKREFGRKNVAKERLGVI